MFLRILEEAGVAFERHDDHFRPGTDDLDWLKEAGRRGWVVVSHNKKIRRVSAQTERLMEAGVRAFMLIGDPRPNRHPGPWIAKLYRAPEGPKRPGEIKMWLSLQAWLKER